MSGNGIVHGYLTDRELSRAVVARWWKTTPTAMLAVPEREFRIMAEFMERSEKARAEAIEAARLGAPTPGRSQRGRPKPGDTIVDGKMDDRW